MTSGVRKEGNIQIGEGTHSWGVRIDGRHCQVV